MKSKKWFLIGAIAFSVLSAHVVLADFQISEIMYDVDGTDTNREWIEVQNTGTSDDDLSKWYFFSDNTKHSLTPETASVVPAGGYAVIAQNPTKFRTDWPGFGGLLFDSSWTGLNNDTATISLKDPDLNDVSPVTYTSSMGASGDGNSLQYINGSWTAGSPTPGVANSDASQSSSASSSTTTNSSATSAPSSTTQTSSSSKTAALKKQADVPGIYTDILAKDTVVTGISFPISAKTIGYSNEALTTGRFLWNFGDGTVSDQTVYAPLTHVYKYPGQYVLTLSYYQSYYLPVPDATDRLIVTAVPAQLSISSVGDVSDPFVQISNTGSYEIPLSGWLLKGATRTFQIPDGTIILPGKKIIFSSDVTLFSLSDIQTVSLLSPTEAIISTYPSLQAGPNAVTSISSASSNVSRTMKKKSSSASLLFPKVVLADTETASSDPIVLSPLTAAADNALPTSNPVPIFYAGLIGIGIAFVLSFFLVRRKLSGTGELSTLSSNDIKIIE